MATVMSTLGTWMRRTVGALTGHYHHRRGITSSDCNNMVLGRQMQKHAFAHVYANLITANHLITTSSERARARVMDYHSTKPLSFQVGSGPVMCGHDAFRYGVLSYIASPRNDVTGRQKGE